MSTSELSPNEAKSAGVSPDSISLDSVLLATFVAAIFLSAALLFAVQPMFTKMVLPRLGGAAAVWSVAMVFFQTALLAGYAYAHWLMRLAPGRRSVIIHVVLMLVACVALPLHIAGGWGRPPATGEAFWLLAVFAVSIGLPFFALAANGPLLQAWFVRTRHPAAKDPYFLYAASNAGSFLALVSYPVLIEPFAPLREQTLVWTIAFYLLIVLIGCCGMLLLRCPGSAADRADIAADEAAAPGLLSVLSWIALAAIPSGLLLAVTLHISTDIAAVPLLWVAPLALYLLTFVIVFQSRPLIPHEFVINITPVVILALVFVVVVAPLESIVGLMALHLGAFFFSTLMCHGELARRRPPARYLTAYYMWISVGGMIGGIFVALIAPRIFNWVAEYPILVALVLLCRPGATAAARQNGQSALLGLLAVATLILLSLKAFDLKIESNVANVFVGVLLGLTVHFWRAPVAFAAIVAFLLIGNYYYNRDSTSSYQVRNFFGVLNAAETSDGRFRVLWHGSTGQGAQHIRDDEGNPVTGRPEMIAEFFAGGGISQVFEAMHERAAGPINYAVVGLGTGSLACAAKPGDSMTYYELDPDIARIARDPKLFSFISECRPDVPIVLGDARLTLAEAPDATYDLIFVDAFIGAAIPTHLLTREAIALYFRKVKPDGVVAIHVTNWNLQLDEVAAGIADANGVILRLYTGGDVEDQPDQWKFTSKVAAMTRKDADFGKLAQSQYWPIRERDPTQRVWTDDYTNVLGPVLRKLQEKREANE